MPPQHFHVTLAFLGSVAEARVTEVTAVAQQVATSSSSVQIVLDSVEFWRKARVLCATSLVGSRRGGVELAETLKSTLVAAGFAPDLKPFRPHVTLARKVQPGIRDVAMTPVLWTFSEFALVESRTQTNGPDYRPLAFFGLAPNEAVF